MAGGRATPGPVSLTLTELTGRPFFAATRCPPDSPSLAFPVLIARDSTPFPVLIARDSAPSPELELLDLRNGVCLSGRSGRNGGTGEFFALDESRRSFSVGGNGDGGLLLEEVGFAEFCLEVG